MSIFEDVNGSQDFGLNGADNFEPEQADIVQASVGTVDAKDVPDAQIKCKNCKLHKWPECYWSRYALCVPCEYLRQGDLEKAERALKREEKINAARERGEIYIKRPKIDRVPKAAKVLRGTGKSKRPKYIRSYEDLLLHIAFAKNDSIRRANKKDYMPCMTPDEVIARAYTGRCFMTGYVYDPYDPNSVKLVMDHDHETGDFRGWIMARCNSMLGHARESEEELALGIQYLQRAKEVRKITNDHAAQYLVQFGGKGGQPGEGWDPFAPKICR